MADYTENRTTTTTVTMSVSRPQMDINFIKTFPGILKIVEIVLSLIVFICSVAGCSWDSRAGWAAFVGFTAFFLTIAFLLLNLFNVYQAHPKIPFLLIEFVYYAVYTFFYLVAASVLAALANYAYCYNYVGIIRCYNCTPAAGAGAFFGFAAMLVFGVDTFLKFRDWRSKTTLARGSAGAPSGGGLP